MPSTTSAIFHAYIYGTAFWYGLRGACRVYDPAMVVGWFRPPSQASLRANDLELYNVRNDGWCLLTLALILLSLSSAIRSSSSSSTSPATHAPHSADALLPYAKAVIAATVLHHFATGVGAYQHYRLDSHYNTSMGVGVWGNVWLVGTGLFTLGWLSGGRRKVE